MFWFEVYFFVLVMTSLGSFEDPHPPPPPTDQVIENQPP